MLKIAIDGPSGAGKSSMAKRLAEYLHFIYVDTGAIYRTTGLACIQNGISCKDEEKVIELLPKLNIEIKYDDDNHQKMYLNSVDVSDAIRTPEISIAASDVSSLPSVRTFLLEMQRRFAREYNVIMDGRDIGTVVLPDADCKIFLTASCEERAKRRVAQLKEKEIDQPFEEVLKDIQYRDYQDTHRETAPLKKADDAVLLDTSEMGIEESFLKLVEIVNEKINRS